MSKSTFVLRGWHVLSALVAFFGLVIAVNVAFAVVAVESFPGEDVRRSYLQGIHYNDVLAERRSQAELGWSASAGFAGAPQNVAIEVRLRDRAEALDGAALQGSLQWPTNAALDRSVAFVAAGDGLYRAQLGDLAPGRWRLRARAERDSEALDFESELTWPPVSQ